MTIFVILISRFVLIFLHAEKSDYPEILEKAIAQAGTAPKILRTDQAMEYNSKEVDAIYRKHNIFKQTTNYYGQHGNCPSEKMGDTIGKGACTVLHDAQLPKKYWGYAVVYAVDSYNHLPYSTLGGRTP